MNGWPPDLDRDAVAALVDAALAEDLGPGGQDVTSAATVPPDLRGTAELRARASGVIAGVPVAALVLEKAGAEVLETASDGDVVSPGTVVLHAIGPVSRLLTVERTTLNLICHLSGVATLTRRWVDAVAGTGAAIRDTRKTSPGLRALEKYAVRCGGGVNHRMGLWDAALVKDNHVAAAGGVTAAFDAVRARFPGLPVEVECDTLEQVAEVIGAGADLVLLDNMSPATMRAAVDLAAGRGVRLEASGGLSLDNAREVAETGVDYLAVGALTHSAPVLDLGLDLVVVGTA
ncbi:MAG TPA: carboxylating nicotinate-nucleotide diphosphorylase [Frankiaceae bacterium]|nr:carboxylating nicotinate-nucleotide diphosphorylase [Frankiaceae bacterium]